MRHVMIQIRGEDGEWGKPRLYLPEDATALLLAGPDKVRVHEVEVAGDIEEDDDAGPCTAEG